MALWNPEIMHLSKIKIDECLEKMQNYNDELLKHVSVFESNVQDEVTSSTKKMISDINVLLRDIKEKIQEKFQLVDKAAQGIASLESKAQSKIKGIK